MLGTTCPMIEDMSFHQQCWGNFESPSFQAV